METSQRIIEMVASFVLGVTYNKPCPKLFELIRFFNMVCADRFAEMTLVEIV